MKNMFFLMCLNVFKKLSFHFFYWLRITAEMVTVVLFFIVQREWWRFKLENPKCRVSLVVITFISLSVLLAFSDFICELASVPKVKAGKRKT